MGERLPEGAVDLLTDPPQSWRMPLQEVRAALCARSVHYDWHKATYRFDPETFALVNVKNQKGT